MLNISNLRVIKIKSSHSVTSPSKKISSVLIFQEALRGCPGKVPQLLYIGSKIYIHFRADVVNGRVIS